MGSDGTSYDGGGRRWLAAFGALGALAGAPGWSVVL